MAWRYLPNINSQDIFLLLVAADLAKGKKNESPPTPFEHRPPFLTVLAIWRGKWILREIQKRLGHTLYNLRNKQSKCKTLYIISQLKAIQTSASQLFKRPWSVLHHWITVSKHSSMCSSLYPDSSILSSLYPVTQESANYCSKCLHSCMCSSLYPCTHVSANHFIYALMYLLITLSMNSCICP